MAAREAMVELEAMAEMVATVEMAVEEVMEVLLLMLHRYLLKLTMPNC